MNSRNGATFSVTLNKFSDMSNEEFEKLYLGDSGAPEDVPSGERA
jgi:hypothetical protein